MAMKVQIQLQPSVSLIGAILSGFSLLWTRFNYLSLHWLQSSLLTTGAWRGRYTETSMDFNLQGPLFGWASSKAPTVPPPGLQESNVGGTEPIPHERSPSCPGVGVGAVGKVSWLLVPYSRPPSLAPVEFMEHSKAIFDPKKKGLNEMMLCSLLRHYCVLLATS